MGKTINRPATESHEVDPTPNVSLESNEAETACPRTAENMSQIVGIREFFAEKERLYAALSDEEKLQVDRNWEVFKKSMNENHDGDRIPYPD